MTLITKTGYNTDQLTDLTDTLAVSATLKAWLDTFPS